MRTSQYTASVYNNNKQHHQNTYKQFTTKSKRGSKEIASEGSAVETLSKSPPSSSSTPNISKSASALNLCIKKEHSTQDNGKISPGLSIFLSKAASVSNLASPIHTPTPNPPSFNTPTHPQPLKFKRASLQVTPSQLSQLHTETKPFTTTRSGAQLFNITNAKTSTTDSSSSPTTLPKSPTNDNQFRTRPASPSILTTATTQATLSTTPTNETTQSTQPTEKQPLSPKPPRPPRSKPSDSPISPPTSPPISPRANAASIESPALNFNTTSTSPVPIVPVSQSNSPPHSSTPPTSKFTPASTPTELTSASSDSATPEDSGPSVTHATNGFNIATPSTTTNANPLRNPKTSFLNTRTFSSPDLNPPTLNRTSSSFMVATPTTSSPTSKPNSRWSTSFKLPSSSRIVSGSAWLATAPTSPRESHHASLSPRDPSPREAASKEFNSTQEVSTHTTPASPIESTTNPPASPRTATPLANSSVQPKQAVLITPSSSTQPATQPLQPKQAVLVKPSRPVPRAPDTPPTASQTPQPSTKAESAPVTAPGNTTSTAPATIPATTPASVPVDTIATITPAAQHATTLSATSFASPKQPRLSAEEELARLMAANELLRKTNNIIQTTNQLLHTSPDPPVDSTPPPVDTTDDANARESEKESEVESVDPCKKILPFFEESPATVKYAPGQGRYMVAKEFIPAGSIVFQNEVPYAAAIMYSSRKNVCNTCQTHVSAAKIHNIKCCAGCEQIYYCSFECKSSHRPDIYHSPLECSVLKRLKSPLHTPCDDDDILIVKLLIRIICARNNHYADPARFEDFMLLADHISDYDEQRWDEMNTLWDLVRELEGEENRGVFSEPKDEIMAILSKIRSNFFGMWSMNGREAIWTGASLYVRCSFFNHSCFPNCLVDQEAKSSILQQLDRNSVGAVVTVRSVCDIQPGEELCLSYIPLDLPTARRQAHLNTNWMFTCQCVRCKDPDADSKPIDAFCCPDKKCAGGLLVPDAQDPSSGRCRICCSIVTIPADRSNMFKSAGGV